MGVSSQTVTPIYARGDDSYVDPRVKNADIPSRPAAERIEPEEPSPEVVDVLGGSPVRYGFAAGYGHFPVVCTLAFAGPSMPAAGNVLIGLRRMRVFAGVQSSQL